MNRITSWVESIITSLWFNLPWWPVRFLENNHKVNHNNWQNLFSRITHFVGLSEAEPTDRLTSRSSQSQIACTSMRYFCCAHSGFKKQMITKKSLFSALWSAWTLSPRTIGSVISEAVFNVQWEHPGSDWMFLKDNPPSCDELQARTQLFMVGFNVWHVLITFEDKS